MAIATQPSSSPNSDVPVIDYEGSGYKTDFWVKQGREYEDATERLALKRLMPPTGRRIVEIGAGFGRLADLYLGYEQIILFDYSRTLLQDAVAQWGDDPRFVFVAGNIYELPFANSVLDTLNMVRVMHHLADVPAALSQIERSLHSESTAILEYANKRNLKAMLRWATKKQTWSPYTPEPIEFVELNFDFHPDWMTERFVEADLTILEQLGVSHFRLPILKKAMGATILSKLDSAIFSIGGRVPVAPSVFTKLKTSNRERATGGDDLNDLSKLFCCPSCRTATFSQTDDDSLSCESCDTIYIRTNGIWDFKTPK